MATEPTISQELKAQFGGLFITVIGAEGEAADSARAEWAEIYLAEHEIVTGIIGDLGTGAIPRLTIYLNDSNPPLTQSKVYFDDSVKPPLIHIHSNGSQPRELAAPFSAALKKYLGETEKEKSESSGPARSVSEQRDGYRKGEKGNFSTGHHGNTGTNHLEPGERTTEYFGNTQGDVNFYQKILDEEREWQIKRFFTRIDEYAPKDFLRKLRVVNGYRQTDIAGKLGISQTSFSEYENAHQSKSAAKQGKEVYIIRLKYCLKILDNNVFRLPEIEYKGHENEKGEIRKIVNPEYALKFLKKFGHERALYPKDRDNLLFDVLRWKIEALKKGEIDREHIPKMATVIKTLLRGKTGGDIINREPFKTRHPGVGIRELSHSLPCATVTKYAAAITETLDYEGKNLKTIEKLLALRRREKKLNLPPEEAYLHAGTAKNIGDFLRIYREDTNSTLDNVGEEIGLSGRRIGQYERDSYFSEKILEKIIEKNCYGLPVGEDSKVRLDIADFMRELHAKGKGPGGRKGR